MRMVVPVAMTGITTTVPADDAAEWQAWMTYPAGARVIRSGQSRVYLCAIDGNTGHDPASAPAWWIDAGPMNGHAMFDPNGGARTTAASGFTAAFDLARAVDTIALTDMDPATVRMRLFSGAVALFDRTALAVDGVALFDGLPTLSGVRVQVDVTAAPGFPAAVGAVVAGTATDLGVTEDGASIAIVDYSRRDTDDFGVTTLVRRAWSQRITVRSRIDSDQVDRVQRAVADARATPALWIAHDSVGTLTTYGFYKDFDVELNIGSTSWCALTIEALPSSDLSSPAGDVAGPGAVSNLAVVAPQPVTPDTLLSSSVAGNDAPFWDGAVTYDAGAHVVVAGGTRIYESLTDANLGRLPADSPGQWLDIGPMNRWAMFDGALGTATVASAPIVVQITARADADTVALLDCHGATVRVEAGGEDRTIGVADRAVLFTGLSIVAGGTVRVTVAPGSDGTAAVGTLIIGARGALGVTATAPSVGIIDYSKAEADAFGSTKAVRRGWAKRMNAAARIDPAWIEVAVRRIAAVRGTAALWIGDDGFDALILHGFAREASIEVRQGGATLSLSVEGMSASDPVSAVPATLPAVVDILKGEVVVGGRPAGPEDVLNEFAVEATRQELGPLRRDVRLLDEGVAALVGVLGTTEGADAAARAAEAARDAAIVARDNANAIGAIVEQSKIEAQSAASDAANSAVASQNHAVTAFDEAATASAQATLAAQSAANALTAQNEASHFALVADGHATAASLDRLDAQAAAGDAVNSATASQGFAVTAGQAAAAAHMTVSLAASSATGHINANSLFLDWDDADPLPAAWAVTGPTAASRSQNARGGPAVRMTAAAEGDAAVIDCTATYPALPDGWFVAECTVRLVSGSLAGATLSRTEYDAAGDPYFGAVQPLSTIDGTGAGVVGRTYVLRWLFQTGASTERMAIALIVNRSDMANPSAKVVDVEALGFRAATGGEVSSGDALPQIEAELNRQATAIADLENSRATVTALDALSVTVGDHTGAISQQSVAIADLATNKVSLASFNTLSATVADNTAEIQVNAGAVADLASAAAIYEVIVGAAGGNPALVRLKAGVGGAEVQIASDRIGFYNPTAPGQFEEVMRLENGDVMVANRLKIGAAGGLIVETTSHMKVIGNGFGTSNQFIEWYGPIMALSACSEANGLAYTTRDGDQYFAGSLSAGVHKNAARTTLLTPNAEIIVGPFTPTGAARTVVLSYAWFYSKQITDTYAPNGTATATIVLERRVGAGAWTTLTTLNVTGQKSGEDGYGAGEPGNSTCDMQGATTFTDNSGGTGATEYRGRLTSRANEIPGGTATGTPTNTQTISVISTEG